MVQSPIPTYSCFVDETTDAQVFSSPMFSGWPYTCPLAHLTNSHWMPKKKHDQHGPETLHQKARSIIYEFSNAYLQISTFNLWKIILKMGCHGFATKKSAKQKRNQTETSPGKVSSRQVYGTSINGEPFDSSAERWAALGTCPGIALYITPFENKGRG